MRLLVLLLCAFCETLLGQGLHIGIKAGIPMTPYFHTGTTASLQGSSEYAAATRRYTAGPTVEWRLTDRFALEVDALYKRMGYVAIVRTVVSGVSMTSALDSKGNSWDFPVMAKYRFGRVVHPFVAAGGVLRYVGPIRARGERTVGDLRTTVDTSDLSELRKRFYPGLTVGGGLEFALGRLHVAPEFRYARWTANISVPGGILRFEPNQAEFLLGILF